MAGSPATPYRTCIGCRRRRPQSELLRVVADAAGRILIDRVAPGRGAWLCNPPDECWRDALRRGAFGRALRRSVEVPETPPSIEVDNQRSGA